jgi:ketosteroid isomerase-like protein
VTGAWRMRGAASGIDGSMEIFIVFTFQDGKIAALEWFADHDTALAAARGD